MAIDGRVVLFRGRPGSGKSESALATIEAGGCLIADDLVELRNESGVLLAGFPEDSPLTLRGLLFSRIRGWVVVPYCGVFLPVAKSVLLFPLVKNECEAENHTRHRFGRRRAS